MANPLDLGLIEEFSTLFAMLFVFVLLYAIFQSTKALGGKKNIDAITAFVVSLMMLLAPNVSAVVTSVAPWFVLMIIFLVFMLLLFRLVGASDSDISATLQGPRGKTIGYWILIVSFIILLAGLGKVYFTEDGVGNSNGGVDRPRVYLENGSTITPGDVGGEPGEETFWATLFHPKVLGMIMIMLTGTFAIALLTTSPMS